jgi:hypothetical protein
VIAVTVLTSLSDADLHAVGVAASPLDQVLRLAELARAAGLDGVVASPQETAAIRAACGPDFVIVTPGIRGGGAQSSPDEVVRIRYDSRENLVAAGVIPMPPPPRWPRPAGPSAFPGSDAGYVPDPPPRY